MQNIKSILIIGGSGYVGTQLALKLREGYKVFATYHRHPMAIPGVSMIPMSIENRNWVKSVVYAAKPDVILYVAGSNQIEGSDAILKRADHVHGAGPATVTQSSDVLQSRFIYLSNSYVFDGQKGNYHESDTVLPFTHLGKAKLAGENHIRSKSLNYVIVRSAPLYGRGNGYNISFMDRLRIALGLGKTVELDTNELHSYAPVEGFAEFISRLMDTGIRNKILHFGGLTKISAYEFGRAFAKKFGYDPELVVPARRQQVTSSGQKQKVQSPSEDGIFDFSLNCSNAADFLKIKPLLLEEGLDLVQKQLVPGL